MRELKVSDSRYVALSVSHISEVMVPRTARAFSRAARRHCRMLPGLRDQRRRSRRRRAA
jgi:hypothetical protein